MRALSMTQPWATLVAIGAKRIETRSWWTAYRGPLAIQAAKSFPSEAEELSFEEPFHSALHGAGYCLEPGRAFVPLPRGAIIAVADLSACISTNYQDLIGAHLRVAGGHEKAFGDFGPDRYAWVFRDIRALREPVPCRGYPSVWPVDADLEHAIAAQLPALAAVG